LLAGARRRLRRPDAARRRGEAEAGRVRRVARAAADPPVAERRRAARERPRRRGPRAPTRPERVAPAPPSDPRGRPAPVDIRPRAPVLDLPRRQPGRAEAPAVQGPEAREDL